MNRTLIIAEAGVNHNGDERLALELVDAACNAGADIVKFQTFKAQNLVTPQAKQAEYQVVNTKKEEAQLSMLSRLELSYEAHRRIANRCSELGIEFLSAAFDHDSLEFLVNELHLKRLKIPSGEITNSPLVLQYARTGKDIIVSTGMANLADIENALGVIAFGYLANDGRKPSIDAFEAAYASEEGRRVLEEKVTILHCTTEYPAPLDEVNLRVLETLTKAFGLPVGYSDHTEGIVVPIVAAARGASIVEKHFTIDRALEGPDHKASLEPDELAKMVSEIRKAEVVLGSTVKAATVSEVKNKKVARKSLVAERPIKAGETFNEGNIGAKRPGSGISPYYYWHYLGKKATRHYQAGDLISE